MEKYQTVNISNNSLFIDAPSKIGIYKQKGSDIYLIDTGAGLGAAIDAEELIKENNWNLKGIINTHSHPDHIGGNNYLQKKFKCDIFVPDEELSFVENPRLSNAIIYGAMPPKEIETEFLYAEPSRAKSINSRNFPKELEVVPLGGHCYNMVGIKTPDGTFFVSDAVSSANALSHYRVTYVYDVKKHLETLEMLKKVEANVFVPSHADCTDNMEYIATYNRDWIWQNLDDVLLFTRRGEDIGEIVKSFFDKYSLKSSFEQYHIVKSTVLSYLTYLSSEGRISMEFVNNRMIYRSIL